MLRDMLASRLDKGPSEIELLAPPMDQRLKSGSRLTAKVYYLSTDFKAVYL